MSAPAARSRGLIVENVSFLPCGGQATRALGKRLHRMLLPLRQSTSLWTGKQIYISHRPSAAPPRTSSAKAKRALGALTRRGLRSQDEGPLEAILSC